MGVNVRQRRSKAERTFAFHIKNDARRQDLVPAVNHPDDPSRVDLANQWKTDVREAGDLAERMDEARIWEKVGI